MNEDLRNSALAVFIFKIQDEELRNGVAEYLGKYWKELAKSPASRTHHHAYSGGLVNHILEVCWMGERIIDSCRLNINKDHFFAVALIHDIGKVGAYQKTDEGKWEHVPQKTRIEHSIIPILEFSEITGIDLPREVKTAILGHMGGWSQTSVHPDDLLSALLHSVDLISSRLDRGNGFEV